MAERRECWSEEDWRAYLRTFKYPPGEEPWWMTDDAPAS